MSEYEQGKGCECEARYIGDCTCDNVDWRSEREVELEAELEKAKGESWRNGGCVDCPAHAENEALLARAVRSEKANRQLASQVQEMREAFTDIRQSINLESMEEIPCYEPVIFNKGGIYDIANQALIGRKDCTHEYESDGGKCIHCGQQGGLLKARERADIKVGMRKQCEAEAIPVSECCGVEMPDFAESDRCPKCKDHTGVE